MIFFIIIYSNYKKTYKSNKERMFLTLIQRELNACKAENKGESSKKIFDMLDLFYANKHMYTKIQHKEEKKNARRKRL